jgi:hypothetical protein
VKRGAVVLVACLALAACNPYRGATELPAPRCRTARDCRPGDHCRAERCEAVRSLVVIGVAREEPLRGWLLTTRDGATDPLAHPSARFVAELALAPGERTVRVDGLPDLCLWLVAWAGGESPEEGDRSAVLRVPEGTTSQVVVAPSRALASAPRRPPPLGFADRSFLFGG